MPRLQSDHMWPRYWDTDNTRRGTGRNTERGSRAKLNFPPSRSSFQGKESDKIHQVSADMCIMHFDTANSTRTGMELLVGFLVSMTTAIDKRGIARCSRCCLRLRLPTRHFSSLLCEHKTACEWNPSGQTLFQSCRHLRAEAPKAMSKGRCGRSCVRYRCGLLNTIQDVLRQRSGWVEVREDGDCDFIWCDVGSLRENFDHSYMEEHMRINHFRNHYELTRKNLMVKNLKRHRKNLERDVGRVEASKCDFFPCTFALPSEYHLFVEEFKRSHGSTWIMKPVAKSQGKGIFLFTKLKDIMDWKKDGTRSEDQKDAAQVESYVVQRYIENPYLINGRKFDLRVYVLVTSYVPLKAWLYRDGFARFSTTRFSLSSIDDKYMHLTNVAVQKTAPDYDPEKGCKWQMQQLRRYLTAKHGREMVDTAFKEMDNIFVRSLQSVQKIIINDKHCFELYGYDILLDKNLKPWLIEVNASPSLSPSSQEDYKMKCGLLEDTLNVVDMEGRLTGKEKRVGGFDLMWNDGPVYREDFNLERCGSSSFTANTHLGCVNHREKELRRLLKPFPGQKRA